MQIISVFNEMAREEFEVVPQTVHNFLIAVFLRNTNGDLLF